MAASNGSPRPLAATTYRIEIGSQALAIEVSERDDGLF